MVGVRHWSLQSAVDPDGVPRLISSLVHPSPSALADLVVAATPHRESQRRSGHGKLVPRQRLRSGTLALDPPRRQLLPNELLDLVPILSTIGS